MNQTLLEKRDKLKDELQLLAGKITKAKFAAEPSGKLRSEFYKKSREYKVIWKALRGGENL